MGSHERRWLYVVSLAAGWSLHLALATSESALAETAGGTVARPNATYVFVRNNGTSKTINLASIAFLAGAGAILIIICSWLVVMEVQARRKKARWRPRLPPRPNHLLLLPSPTTSEADEGYVEPRWVPGPHLLSSDPAASRAGAGAGATGSAQDRARAHSYLLLLSADQMRPYEEAWKTAGGLPQDQGSYLQPKMIPLLRRAQAGAGAEAAGVADGGYLPMNRRAVPSIFKVLKNGDLAIDLSAVYDEYLHMAPEKPEGQQPPQNVTQRGCNTEANDKAVGGNGEELKVIQESPLIPVSTVDQLPTVIQPQRQQQNVAPKDHRIVTVHPYETVPASPILRQQPLCSIQNRVLPPPPLPPPPSTPRPGCRRAM